MILSEIYKHKIDQRTIEQYRDVINGMEDFYGDGYDGMSALFYLWNKRYLHWLDNDPEIAVSEKEIRFRRKFYSVLQKIGPGALACTQVYENRRLLDDPHSTEADSSVVLPERPVIFVSNHGFHDDVLATTLAAGRHAYYLTGSLPLIYNTVDGFACALVGGICVNRNSKSSRGFSLAKALKVLECGTDMILFPEGGWNKTPSTLVLPLWKGVYDISYAAKCEVVPITHYVRDMEILDKANIIHTVVDDPIPLYELPQQEALSKLRDIFASWEWKMMERYGQSTRSAEMGTAVSSDERWDQLLRERMKGVSRYDSRIEKTADYRPKEIVRIEDVFQPIANVPDEHITGKNVKFILDARQLVAKYKEIDFQRKY